MRFGICVKARHTRAGLIAEKPIDETWLVEVFLQRLPKPTASEPVL